jgi:hypothetical protein
VDLDSTPHYAKEAEITYQNLRGGTKEYHEKPQNRFHNSQLNPVHVLTTLFEATNT